MIFGTDGPDAQAAAIVGSRAVATAPLEAGERGAAGRAGGGPPILVGGDALAAVGELDVGGDLGVDLGADAGAAAAWGVQRRLV